MSTVEEPRKPLVERLMPIVFGLGFGFAFSDAIDGRFDVVFWIAVVVALAALAWIWRPEARRARTRP